LSDDHRNWHAHVAQAVTLLLAVAIGARVIWYVLAPLVPGLIVLSVLAVIYAFVFGRFRR